MMQTVIPQLRISNAQRSLAFYVEALGFEVDWEHQFEPGYPLFFQLTREQQTIFLTEHAGDCEVGGAVYFRVPDAASLCATFVARGAVPREAPAATPWGTVEFMLIDPDGNRLRFASEADE
jgi:catechol 2,3-dioxygenase-like lactoylglutathione lyase family enzyme